MRLQSLTRLVIACLVLALCAGDLFAGPIRDRIRGRRAGASCQTCAPSYSPAQQSAVRVLAGPQSSCANGRCPIPAK